MAIDHKLITPIMNINDPMLSCDIVGTGVGRCGFKVNQTMLITNQTYEYCLAYRRQFMSKRGLIVPADYERVWRKTVKPLWTPEHYSSTTGTIAGWWKADTIYDKADGATITSIDDDSDNSNTLTSSTVSLSLRRINDLSMIDMTNHHFVTGDKMLAADDDSIDLGTNPFELYMLWTPAWGDPNVSITAMFMDKRPESDNGYQFHINSDGGSRSPTLKMTIIAAGTARNSSDLTFDSLVDDQPYLSSVVRNPSNIPAFFMNGTAYGTAGTFTNDLTSTDALYIGSGDDAGSQHPSASAGLRGYFGEAVIVNSGAIVVGTQIEDRERMEGYLANKWGFSLPSGHTYETEPPRLDTWFS